MENEPHVRAQPPQLSMFPLLRGFSKNESGIKQNPKHKQDNLPNISHSSGPQNFPSTATLPLPK